MNWTLLSMWTQMRLDFCQLLLIILSLRGWRVGKRIFLHVQVEWWCYENQDLWKTTWWFSSHETDCLYALSYILYFFIYFYVFTDTLSASCFLLMLWTSYHFSFKVSRMFSKRISCLLLKYASNGMRFINMNVDGI